MKSKIIKPLASVARHRAPSSAASSPEEALPQDLSLKMRVSDEPEDLSVSKADTGLEVVLDLSYSKSQTSGAPASTKQDEEEAINLSIGYSGNRDPSHNHSKEEKSKPCKNMFTQISPNKMTLFKSSP